LNHFQRPRLINIVSKDSSEKRKRDVVECDKINETRGQQREAEAAKHTELVDARNDLKKTREDFKNRLFEKVDVNRASYKTHLQDSMDRRLEYRESIVTRKEKEKNLTDLLTQERIDLKQLQESIAVAKAHSVNETIIQMANKKLEWLKYSKEVEQLLVVAIQEKVKENLLAILERIEKEQVFIDPKLMNDAKSILSKMK